MAPMHIQEQGILFIGINPSFSPQHLPIQYYDPYAPETPHPFFIKLIDVANHVGLPWSHVDLLFFRETNGRYAKELLKTDLGREFIQQQLPLALQLIKAAKPRVIVIANALAGRLFRPEGANGVSVNPGLTPTEWDWNEQWGTYRWVATPGDPGIPVFLSSMLSGAGALDTGSYKRLKWHIRHALTTPL